jgi:hypothetical protein
MQHPSTHVPAIPIESKTATLILLMQAAAGPGRHRVLMARCPAAKLSESAPIVFNQ